VGLSCRLAASILVAQPLALLGIAAQTSMRLQSVGAGLRPALFALIRARTRGCYNDHLFVPHPGATANIES